MVDRNVIKRRLNHVYEGLENLKAFLSVDEDEFVKDNKTVSAVKYEVIRIFEAISSICQHIVSKEFKMVLTTYRECFRIMAERKIIPENLARNLSEMAKFRNILIHMYQIVDNRRLYREVRKGLLDIEQYAEVIKQKLL